MTNAADPKSVRAMNRRERRAKERRILAVKAAWATPETRSYMWDLMAFAGFLKTPMTGNAWTEFNCGAQNVANRMFADVQEACPEMFLLAMEEAKSLQKREGIELAQLEPPEKEEADG